MLTIQKLRQNGFKVRSTTFRYCYTYGKKLLPISAIRAMELQTIILSKGGKVEVCASKDGKAYVAESLCSINDNFQKKEGLKIALERLEEKMILADVYREVTKACAESKPRE